MMPSDTSVSIEHDPCRAAFHAAWWNGHAAHPATGTASTTRTHCQPGNRNEGNNDSNTDRSPSGTKNTTATSSLFRKYVTTGPRPGRRQRLRPGPHRPPPHRG